MQVIHSEPKNPFDYCPDNQRILSAMFKCLILSVYGAINLQVCQLSFILL